ncbi:ABC transporter ATP-binding protein [Bacillus cereus group sp. N21]|uniref:ABC transporter ATP-binding protein n=1 Tax=Bacillus cereus group sp. N21 TaxID=2794591 RepID=UPI0018F3FB71|nr:ABC transporter ATP-binding protein [Bacillus cereus group sp. N21]MBJ8030426.1 ABC transporter ATP-binding protein [Bacillus cereus group sp. N21]
MNKLTLKRSQTLKIYKWTLSFLKPYKWKLLLIILSGLLITSSELAIPKLIQYIIDTILPLQDKKQLGYVFFIMFGLVSISILLSAVRNLWQRQLIEKSSRDSQFAAFKQLRDLGFAYFEQHSVGETLSFMNTQMQAVQKIYRQYLPTTIEHTIFTLVSLCFMLQISVLLTLIIVPSFLFYYIFGPFLERKASTYSRTNAQTFQSLQKKLYESLASMGENRTSGHVGWDLKRVQNLHSQLKTNYEKAIFFAYLRGTNRRLSYYIGAIATFLCGALLVQNGSLSTGEFVAYILYYFSAMHILTSIVTAITEQRMLMYQIEPLYLFMQRIPEVIEPTEPTSISNVLGEITFSNVGFGYSKRPCVLQEFNLKIKAGERVALVGKSGGGKSTVLKLIGRFYDPQQGNIYLDSINLRDLSFAQLRDSIGFVFQETYLFNTSIKENIRFGNPDATDAEIYEAAKLSHCHEFIMQLDKGYDTHIGERGFKLSGGQKQRIAIARMIVKNPSIVVLDEATSALDNISEKEVQSAFNKLLINRTVITIAHRLSTIKDFDRIVFIEEGKIIESGSWQELMEQRGRFYKLASGISSKGEVIV